MKKSLSYRLNTLIYYLNETYRREMERQRKHHQFYKTLVKTHGRLVMHIMTHYDREEILNMILAIAPDPEHLKKLNMSAFSTIKLADMLAFFLIQNKLKNL